MIKRNIKSSFDYKEINDFIMDESKSNEFKNYIYYFTSEDSRDTSISIEFEEPTVKGVYGLSPSVNTEDIIAELQKEDSFFRSEESIYKYVGLEVNKDIWSIPSYDETMDPKRHLLVKSLLSMSQFFYIDLDIQRIPDPKDFLNILDSVNNNDSQYRFSFYDILSENNNRDHDCNTRIRVYGRLPDVILLRLEEKAYRYTIESENIFVSLNEDGERFSTLYLEKDFEHLQCTSDFFYNGVNIRLKEVRISKHSSGNNSIQELKLMVERTTFGTICGFDGHNLGKSTHKENNVVGHPYLHSARETLIKIVKDEATLVRDFTKKLKNDRKSQLGSIVLLNEYLAQSIYPHFINISENIVTNDGYWIYTERNSSVTDSGTLYCSVNGVAEVMDPLVKHYDKLYSDRPRLTYHVGSPSQDFNEELERESTCELGLSYPHIAWTYYGFSIMGLLEGTKVDTSHINILANKHIDCSFENVKKSWLTASEKNENRQLFGIKINVHFGRIRTFFAYFNLISNIAYNHKDIIVLVGTLATILGLVFVGNWENVIRDITTLKLTTTSIQDMVFKFFTVILSTGLLMNYFKTKKGRVTIHLCIVPSNRIRAYYTKIFKKRSNKSHPILYLMTALHLRDKIKQKSHNVVI